MAATDKLNCGNPDCGQTVTRREMKGSMGGTLLCPECWPMGNARPYPSDPVVDNRPRYKCARPGCRNYSLPSGNRFTGRGYCSAECELRDIEPGVAEGRREVFNRIQNYLDLDERTIALLAEEQ